jgi:hypothetical protein
MNTTSSPKTPLGKVILINFGIMLIYTAFLWTALDERDPYAKMEASILNAVWVAVHVGANWLLGFILANTTAYKHLATALFIAGAIIAAIGFGTCLAIERYQ